MSVGSRARAFLAPEVLEAGRSRGLDEEATLERAQAFLDVASDWSGSENWARAFGTWLDRDQARAKPVGGRR